jgi:hypothetical protein
MGYSSLGGGWSRACQNVAIAQHFTNHPGGGSFVSRDIRYIKD